VLALSPSPSRSVAEEDKLVIVRGTEFQNGVIEVDLAGKPSPGAPPLARGFIGVAFHINKGASKFEYFYLRPTNARADDQLRRNHSAQYAAPFLTFPGSGRAKNSRANTSPMLISFQANGPMSKLKCMA
jgi:hypothetical protein